MCKINFIQKSNSLLFAIVLNKFRRLSKIHDAFVYIVSEISRKSLFFKLFLHHLEYFLDILTHLPHVFLPNFCFYRVFCFVLRMIFVEPYFWPSKQIQADEFFVWNERTMEGLHSVKCSISCSEYAVALILIQVVHFTQFNRHELSQYVA